MARTKKVKAAGKFGSRYGLKTRKRFLDINRRAKKKHICPKCLKDSLRRVAAGIYECKKCKNKITGGAYAP